MNEGTTKYMVSWGDQQPRKKVEPFYNPTESVTNVFFTWKYHMLLEEHKQIHKQSEIMCYMRTMQTTIRNCCKNTNRATARYNYSSVTSSIIITMNESRLKITRIYVCKYQSLSVTFAKNTSRHKNGRETQDYEESANIL